MPGVTLTVTQDGALTWTIGGVTFEVKARRRNNFDPDQPRDRKGRWIETGASVSIWGGGKGIVERNLGGGYLEVRTPDERKLRVHRNYLTVTQRPNGAKPSDRNADRPRPLRASKPSKDIEDYSPPTEDTRVPVGDLKPGQIALVYGHDQYGEGISWIGHVEGVSPAGPPEGADTKPGDGWAVSFKEPGEMRVVTIYAGKDAVARVVPNEDFDRLAEAERSGDEQAASRLAIDIYNRITDADDEAAARPANSGKRPDATPDAVPDRVPAASSGEVSDADAEQMILGAVAAVSPGPGRWAAMTALREQLSNLPREQQDRILLDLILAGRVDIEPVAIVRDLKPKDHDAAIVVGNTPNHQIRLADGEAGAAPAPAPMPARTPAPAMPAPADAAPEPAASSGEISDADAETIILDAVGAVGTGRWATMPALREQLGDLPREQQDRVLLTLMLAGRVDLEPTAIPGNLKPEDHAAAIMVGPTPNHQVRLAAQVEASPEEAAPTSDGPVSPSTVTAGDIRSGDRVMFDVPITAANVERFSGGSNPPKAGDLVTVRGVLAADPEEDMFGGHTVRLADGARWESGRGIGPLGPGGREFLLDEGHAVHKVGTAQPRKPVAGPGPRVQQDGLFLEADRAGTAEMFDPYASDFETVGAEPPNRSGSSALAPEEPSREEASARDAEGDETPIDFNAQGKPIATSQDGAISPEELEVDPEGEGGLTFTFVKRRLPKAESGIQRPDRNAPQPTRDVFEVRGPGDSARGDAPLGDVWEYKPRATKYNPDPKHGWRWSAPEVGDNEVVHSSREAAAAALLAYVDSVERPYPTRTEHVSKVRPGDVILTDQGSADGVAVRVVVDEVQRVSNADWGIRGRRDDGKPKAVLVSIGAPEVRVVDGDRPEVAVREVPPFVINAGMWIVPDRQTSPVQVMGVDLTTEGASVRVRRPGGDDEIISLPMSRPVRRGFPIGAADQWGEERDARLAAASSGGPSQEANAGELVPGDVLDTSEGLAVVGRVTRVGGDAVTVDVVGGDGNERLLSFGAGDRVTRHAPAGLAQAEDRSEPTQAMTPEQGMSDAELDARVAQGNRRVDAARAAGARNRDDGDSALAEALNAPLAEEQAARQQRAAAESPAVPERPPAPDGQAYADEVKVGDTLAEAQWRTPSAGDGRLRQGSSTYAQPGGPARLGEPDRASRTVTALVPVGDESVRIVFDDGTSILRGRDDLVARGAPAEVVEDGRRVGEWVPAKTAAAGDRIRFVTGTPTLPTRLDREALGLGRGERLTVEGTVVRRQPGQPTAVLAGAELIRADGSRVPVDQELSFRLPGRVVRLDESEAVPEPQEVLPGGLHEGDRISTPTGDVQVDSVEPLSDTGVVVAKVRDDDDRRTLRALDEQQPVRLAPDTPTLAAPEPEAEQVPVELAEPVPLREGTPAGRVRLRTDQRRRLLALNLDDLNGSATEGVRRAAARLRARQDLSSEQMHVLADHLRRLADDETQPGAQRRAFARTASWIDAAEARLEGFPPPPHDPHRDAPEKAHAKNLTMGDVIALPDSDGNVSYGTVTVVRPIKGFGLVAVHLRRDDGTVEQRVLPDGVDLWVLPDLPEDRPAPPRPDVREHIRLDRLNPGDDIVIGNRRFGTPITGTVVSVERTNRELSATEWYDVTVRAEDGSETTVPLGDRGWASVVRTKRGPHSAGQGFAAAMPEENPEPVGRDAIRAGDRALIEGVTGVVTTISNRPGGTTFTLMGDDGQQHTIPVFDDGDEPPAIVRLIAADDNASARIIQQMRRRELITREREFTDFLAGVETRTSRTAAAGLAGRMRAMPEGASRDDVLDAAEEHLDSLERGDDAGAAAALARRLGARDEAQQAELARLTKNITDGVAERATSRIRAALEHVDVLPGESWADAVARLAASYRDHPPTDRLALAGRSLEALHARLREADTSREQPSPALPDGADLPARLASYRAALPADLADLGKQPVSRAVFDPTTLAELENARVPTVRTETLWAPDVADDDGPGEQAMAHLATLRAAGRDVDVRYQHHLGGRDVALQADLDSVIRRRGQAYTQLDLVDRDVVRLRQDGRDQAARNAGHEDFAAWQAAAPQEAGPAAAAVEQSIPRELIQRREAAGAEWQKHATREAELRGLLATARRDALVATLTEIRPMGGKGITYTDRGGKTMTGRAGSNAAALQYAEQALPADWLAAARALGPVEVVTGRGQHRHDPETGKVQIGLPADQDSALAYRDGAAVRVPVPSSQPGQVPKAGVAAHELAHHMEAAIPGLVEAERLLHFDRTSSGEFGDRTQGEPITGSDRGTEFTAYPGDFPNAYTGRVYRDGDAYEVFTSAFESLAGGRDSADDDLRHWGLGVLALLGTDQSGPSGGKAVEAPARDPLEGIDIDALSDTRLRQLLARISDPDARARLRAELDTRNQPPPADEDLSSLSEADLLDRLEKGWARYGEDPDVTRAQDRVIAELEGRQQGEQRGLDDLTASDLATMDTDDLAGILTGNWHRYDAEQSVAAMLDQIMAELDGRDQARHAEQDDPYAGIDLSSKTDDELEELRAQHEASYDSDPNSARLTKRIFAEMDDRDVRAATAGEDQRSDTDRRIDDLITQGWTPRDAYAEVHGLDPDEIERQERLALVDAERQKGERREDTLRRMHRQWVHEQWLEAEGATRGVLLNRAGVAAGIDPKSLWAGNSARAAKYASEELKRWWADRPNGGRQTYAEWRAQWVGDQAARRGARERRQSSSNGRDFGV
ncbi:hypothetical protein [Streptosporangium sp. NPDC048865]|uniref:hypothetical protein n=1 Tax=Streptosporangium sp. NPDC048865 TaxID=3155766 RepID=UPI00342DC616